MKKLLKIFLILLSVPVLLFSIAVAMLVAIDLNDYRSEIEQLVAENTGRKLTVNGELKKSFFPWLGVNLTSVSLSNAKGFKPDVFASVEKIEIKIDTLSLIRFRPRISRVVVLGLNLNLARDSNGVNNWDDLSQPEATVLPPAKVAVPATTQAAPKNDGIEALALLRIEGLTIDNARVQWDDAQSAVHYVVSHVNLSVDEIALGKPLAVELGFEMAISDPKLKAKVMFSSSHIEWDLQTQRYALKPLSLKLEAEGEGLPANALSVQLQMTLDADVNQQTLNLNQVKLTAMGANLQGDAQVTQLLDAPRYQMALGIAAVNPRHLLKALSIPIPETADKKALTSLSLDAKIKGDLHQVQLSPLTINLDDTTVEAELSLKDFSQPTIKTTISLDTLDLDRYFPPVAEKPVVAATGDTIDDSKLQTQQLPIPVELIRSLDLSVNVNANKLIVRQLNLDDGKLQLRVKDGVATINPLSLKTASGSIRSELALDVRQSKPKFRVKQEIKQVKAAPLAKAFAGDEYVSGILNLQATVDSRGDSIDAIKKQLNGNLKFQFDNGAVKGVNLGELIRKAKAKLDKKEYAPSKAPKQTDFAQIMGSATIRNGIVANDDLRAKSPLLRVEGEGKVNLAVEKLDYLVTTYVVDSSKGQTGKERNELQGIPIPIQLTGPFSAIEWDYKWSIIRKALQEKLKKSTKKKVKAKKQKAKKETKQKLRKKKKKELDKLKDKLKNKFKL
jgi:AsmA protein